MGVPAEWPFCYLHHTKTIDVKNALPPPQLICMFVQLHVNVNAFNKHNNKVLCYRETLSWGVAGWCWRRAQAIWWKGGRAVHPTPTWGGSSASGSGRIRCRAKSCWNQDGGSWAWKTFRHQYTHTNKQQRCTHCLKFKYSIGNSLFSRDPTYSCCRGLGKRESFPTATLLTVSYKKQCFF